MLIPNREFLKKRALAAIDEVMVKAEALPEDMRGEISDALLDLRITIKHGLSNDSALIKAYHNAISIHKMLDEACNMFKPVREFTSHYLMQSRDIIGYLAAPVIMGCPSR